MPSGAVLAVMARAAVPASAPVDLPETCGAEPGLVCRNVYDWTGNPAVARFADWITSVPLRITLIFSVAWLLNRIMRRFIRRVVDHLGEPNRTSPPLRGWRKLREVRPLLGASDGHALRSAARARTFGLVLRGVASMGIWGVAWMLALDEIGVNLAPLIAGAGVVGVALGFGAQSLVKDFLSGIFMLVEDQYGVGDIVDLGEASGVVEAVSLRTTRLRSVEGTVWHVPNGEIRRVGNKSQQWARALLDISVAYDSDVDLAARLVKEVADELWRDPAWSIDVIEEPEVWGIENLGADGIALRLAAKTRPGEQFRVARELRRRIKDRFDASGIEIPFPQRTVWVRRDAGTSRDETDLADLAE